VIFPAGVKESATSTYLKLGSNSMKMISVDIKAYPKLAHYVKNDLHKVIDVPSIVSAMNKIAQLNRAKLKIALSWNSGPTIKIAPLVGAYGEFTPNTKSNEIRIQEKMVREFEAGRGKRVSRAGNVYLVGVTLLHELVHWGDDQDGIDRPGEEGSEFERLIYGSVIH